MKKKKNIFIITSLIIIIVIIGIVLLIIFNNKNKLTIAEREWLDNNINKVQNINVVNNVNVFGQNGIGIYYDFLNDFSKYYDITINPITYNKNETISGINLGLKTSITDNDIVFYKDHYVLVSKNKEIIAQEEVLKNKKITVLNNDLNLLKNYLDTEFNPVASQEELLASLEENNYIIVPLMEYLDVILKNNYYVLYHFSDATIYYTMQKDDSILSHILEKYYYNWQESFNDYFNQQEFALFTNCLNISEAEVANLQSIEYNYGFVNNSPYEVIMGGEYGGIVAIYLSRFSDFAKVDFNFSKYKNFTRFDKAIKDKKIDIYFNYYNFTNEYSKTSGIPINYALIARRDNDTVLANINSLKGKSVYVLENSLIYEYLKSIPDLKLITYKDQKELFKLNKKDVYIAMDYDSFDYYKDKELNNYSTRYVSSIPYEYEFRIFNKPILQKLLDKYMMINDNFEVRLLGLNNHYETVKVGSIFSRIAQYIIYLMLIVVLIILLIIRKSRKIIIAKKIRKDDKLKFIDQLTSLKNRNFLNENISVWNNNTIYPQTIIVIDLNKIQEINDVEGYEEGDKQIKAAANILIKTQLDNSEIMRTDGNEFVIYLVGYSQKQISNYLHKLNKEIKKLPYQNGAEFGYSMILDDIKTIEDALNEAVDQVKKQKSDDSEKNFKK